MINSYNRIFTLKLSFLFLQIFYIFPQTVAAIPIRACFNIFFTAYIALSVADNTATSLNVTTLVTRFGAVGTTLIGSTKLLYAGRG